MERTICSCKSWLIPAAAFLLCLSMASCRNSKDNTRETTTGIEPASDDFRCKIRHAIIEQDSSLFASLCRYPILREYPLRDIEDSVAMSAYFNTLVDDSLRDILLASDVSDWEGPLSWHGHTLLDGSYLWCDEGEIYRIPYQSEKELELLGKLIETDLASLPPELAEGWRPETCLSDSTGTIYRIDKTFPCTDEDEVYRLMVYPPGTPMKKSLPSKILTGFLLHQGSAAVPEYTFSDDDGNTWTYCFIWFEDCHFLTISSSSGSSTKKIILKKTYWL